ncbi:MAG: TonB-dependent receptor plug domain-containing protein [Desulfobacterales bacterium]|nr:TonB-dependent receptor plug domain-containing protein [Desulfobacterales bacterium]
MNVKSIVKNLLLCFLIVPVLGLRQGFASENYMTMSLEELLAVDVSLATLTGMELSKIPAAITIITREDIEKTPARHILDLIEVYVPGAMIRNHHSGPQTLKIRGQGERNYKTILLVNGRPVNQKAFNGSTVEITNWDMNDIERVEVVRGPGSVTYGPGAIAGVINIITKQAGSLDGFKAGVEYNEGYDSKGVFLAQPELV